MIRSKILNRLSLNANISILCIGKPASRMHSLSKIAWVNIKLINGTAISAVSQRIYSLYHILDNAFTQVSLQHIIIFIFAWQRKGQLDKQDNLKWFSKDNRKRFSALLEQFKAFSMKSFFFFFLIFSFINTFRFEFTFTVIPFDGRFHFHVSLPSLSNWIISSMHFFYSVVLSWLYLS